MTDEMCQCTPWQLPFTSKVLIPTGFHNALWTKDRQVRMRRRDCMIKTWSFYSDVEDDEGGGVPLPLLFRHARTSRTRILTKQSTPARNLYPPDLIWIEDLWTRSAPGLWVQLSSELVSGVQHGVEGVRVEYESAITSAHPTHASYNTYKTKKEISPIL